MRQAGSSCDCKVVSSHPSFSPSFTVCCALGVWVICHWELLWEPKLSGLNPADNGRIPPSALALLLQYTRSAVQLALCYKQWRLWCKLKWKWKWRHVAKHGVPYSTLCALHFTHPSAHTQQWVVNKHIVNTHLEQWTTICCGARKAIYNVKSLTTQHYLKYVKIFYSCCAFI